MKGQQGTRGCPAGDKHPTIHLGNRREGMWTMQTMKCWTYAFALAVSHPILLPPSINIR